jgi:hypothetical protein
MSRIGAASCAAVQISDARAAASRHNGAKSRGPKTPEGRARSAQNALKHGMRAEKHIVLPDEDAAEFAGLEAALVEELEPVGALQTVLARRVAVAAWRLARADRIELELFTERRAPTGGLGLALIRDGNGARSFETLLRYRGAAIAEFWRALKTLKTLQAEQTLETDAALAAPSLRTAPRPPLADRAQPNEPERAPARPEYLLSAPATAGALHEPSAPWTPNEPETEGSARLKQPQIPAEPTAPAGQPYSSLGEHQVRISARQTNPSAVGPTSRGADESLMPPCSGARRRLRSASPCSGA